MNNHLVNLKSIMDRFIKKHKFIIAYLSITGHVSHLYNSKLSVQELRAWDHLKLCEIKEIEAEIYQELKKYLCNNKIEKTLIIRDAQRRGWANCGVDLVFEESINCN